MKKKICLLVMISLIISNIYCGEEDAVESLIEAIETERKLVLRENDYEIIGEEEGGMGAVAIKILNEDMIIGIRSKMIEPGIIYINGKAKFVNYILFHYDSSNLAELLVDDFGIICDIWIEIIGMEHVVILQENDYGIFSSDNGYLEIVILNENIMERIKETMPPVIFIYMDGSVKIVKGMRTLDSSRPFFPCDYILWTDMDHKPRFDYYGILLCLVPRDFVERQKIERQEILLQEDDYEIIRESNGRLTIKILNKDKLKEIRKAIDPEIRIRAKNDGSKWFARGMKVSDLEHPLECNYTFEINANNKVIFSNFKRDSLVLTPIEEYLIKYLENLDIQHDIQYTNGLNDGISVLNNKEHINIRNIILIILLVAIGGFITYWIAFRRKV